MSREMELAGLVDPAGKLGRPVPTGQIVVPTRVWLAGRTIRWDGSRVCYREASKNMLSQFVRLDDGDSVLRFAQKWGVMALAGKKILIPGNGQISGGAEPVEAWLYYARRARAILSIVAALKQDKLGYLDDWNQLGFFVVPGTYTTEHEKIVNKALTQHKFGLGFSIIASEAAAGDITAARGAIADEIGSWLDCWKRKESHGRSDFSLRWNGTRQQWELQIDYHGLLFAAIAVQLALVIADADSLYSCSGCGRPYIRPRERKQPKRGWANYCDKCTHDRVAERRAVQKYREKKASALRMHARGRSIRQIADELDTEPARIGSWITKSGD